MADKPQDDKTGHISCPVLKGVVYPPVIMGVPPQLFAISISITMFPAAICVVFFDLSPGWFFPLLFVATGYFAWKNRKNRHYIHSIKALGAKKRTKVIAPAKGGTRFAA